MRRISLFLIAGIIAIAIYAGVNSFRALTEQAVEELAVLQLNYDAYSEGINTVLYDTSGAINYTLQADRQVHFNDDSTELDKPFIRLYEGGNSRWNIVANSGRISPLYPDTSNATPNTTTASVQTIELSGEVEVYSLDELGNRLQMTTDYLTLNTQDKTLETDRLVTLVTDMMQLTSAGMFADLNLDSVIFKREFRGRYEITPN